MFILKPPIPELLGSPVHYFAVFFLVESGYTRSLSRFKVLGIRLLTVRCSGHLFVAREWN